MTVSASERRIQEVYSSLSRKKKRLANFLIENWRDAAFVSAVELGRQLDMSQSAIIRFASELGYSGYPELQRELQDRLRQDASVLEKLDALVAGERDAENLSERVFQRDVANLRDTASVNSMDAIDRAVELIMRARKVLVAGHRSTAIPAHFLAYHLNWLLGNAQFLSPGLGEWSDHVVRLTDCDLFVAFSFPQYSMFAPDAASMARERGASVIAITDSAASPIASLADVLLLASTKGVSFVRSHAGTFFLMDLLLARLGVLAEDRVRASLEEFERIPSRAI